MNDILNAIRTVLLQLQQDGYEQQMREWADAFGTMLDQLYMQELLSNEDLDQWELIRMEVGINGTVYGDPDYRP